MGYYTEFMCKVTLKRDTPKEMLDVLDRIINDFNNYFDELAGIKCGGFMSVNDTPKLPINHSFGECLRWHMLFHSNNFDPENIKGSSFNKRSRKLSIHSEFKNYDDEIRLFCKWIRDFIDLDKDVELWSKGEDADDKENLRHRHGI
jgi:hypothetical protein